MRVLQSQETGKFWAISISNEIGDLSLKEKRAICGILNLRLTGDMFFEVKTTGAVSDLFLPPSVNEVSGRKFWVYPPGKPLPA
jgi:hypothetical protein